ncbi:MAG: hypothetical protein H6806_08460 [Planctomycetes bacterium]|nr:hypothetical protein [Planctomycetota bacterium]MCB9825641.1 hypothetical protein [Planctomycetota bacterium]MCB9829778.1 hypothetical protein [Planctomycetota bacterium]
MTLRHDPSAMPPADGPSSDEAALAALLAALVGERSTIEQGASAAGVDAECEVTPHEVSPHEVTPQDVEAWRDRLLAAGEGEGDMVLDASAPARELAVDMAGAQADLEAREAVGEAPLPARLREVLVGLHRVGEGEVASVEVRPAAPVVVPVPGEGRILELASARERAPAAPRSWRGWAAAAAVLLGLFLWSPWSARLATAEPGLSPTFLRRMDWASSVRRMPRGEPVRFLAVGSELEAGRDEWMGVGFAGDGLVVVDEGAPLAIAPWPEGMKAHALGADLALVGDGRAVLAASRGTVRMTAGARALPVRLGDLGLFVLLRGAAHVELDADVRPVTASGVAEVAAGHPAVALAEGSAGLWWPLGGAAPQPLVAGARTSIAADGCHAFGDAEASLFRELRFFGGDVPPTPLERRVPARALRFLSGAASAQGAATRVPAGAVARWRWHVPDALACADLMRLDVDAPVGTTWRLPQLGLSVASRSPEASTAVLEPGVAPLELMLAEGWFERLEGRPLEVELEVPAGERAADVHALVVRRPPLGAAPGEIGEMLR